MPSLFHMATSSYEPVVVGLYAVSGFVKTPLLHTLEEALKDKGFTFYNESKMLAEALGDVDVDLSEVPKEQIVQCHTAFMEYIRKDCVDSGKVGVIDARFKFWSRDDGVVAIYTHIIYLDDPTVAPGEIPRASRHKEQLRRFCRDHGILFSLPPPRQNLLDNVLALLNDFQRHNRAYNWSLAKATLDKVLLAGQGLLETVLVMAADGTLTVRDTKSTLSRRIEDARGGSPYDDLKLTTSFGSPLGHSYTAFRQAMLMYEELSDDEYDSLCHDAASEISIYPEFLSLLRKVTEKKHVCAVVITTSPRRLWEKILEKEDLPDVKVIGGGRIKDGFVVTSGVKAALVYRLRLHHHKFVWAFGDGPSDVRMMQGADKAILVVDERRSKSIGMMNAIDSEGIQAHQAVLPTGAASWLDLAVIELRDHEFFESILCHRRQKVFHATHRNAAKLLFTPLHDTTMPESALREAKTRVGWYLAIEFLANIIGIEGYDQVPNPHVPPQIIAGWRLQDEQNKYIVALMPAGEPMALGVHKAFPLATFITANSPEDIERHHLREMQVILLVALFVSSKNTVAQFVQHIRNINPTVRIVIVTSAINAQVISEGTLARPITCDENLSIVSLLIAETAMKEKLFVFPPAPSSGNRMDTSD